MSRLSDIMAEKDMKYLSEILGDLLTQVLRFRKIVIREIRPWPDFFAAFKLPASGGIRQRCIGNLNHYWANYTIIGLSVFTVRMFFAPFLLFSFVFIICFNIYFLLYIGDIQISHDLTLTGWLKQFICATMCFIFLGITRGLEHLLWNVIFIIILCGSHMISRPRSVTASTDSSNELKLHGLNWFLSGGTGNSEEDPENPNTANIHEEELFLNSYSTATSASNSSAYNASMRKRH